jgi:hypothetical protein
MKSTKKVTKVHYLHDILPIYSNESMGFALKGMGYWVSESYGLWVQNPPLPTSSGNPTSVKYQYLPISITISQ